MRVIHKNCLSGYLGNARIALAAKVHAEGQSTMELRIPQPLQSLSRHEYNLCVMLSLFDERLKRFEETINDERPEYGAYSEALTFLDSIYLFMRLLLDSAAGIVRHYNKCSEKDNLPKSFGGLLKKSKKGQLPEGLNEVFSSCETWFSQLKDRRDDIVHNYETYFIGFGQNTEGGRIVIQFSPRDKTPVARDEDLRSYLGLVMAGYQRFVDRLLDHWDVTFYRRFGIVASIDSRQITMLEGRSANILWWAHRYGEYRHDALVFDE